MEPNAKQFQTYETKLANFQWAYLKVYIYLNPLFKWACTPAYLVKNVSKITLSYLLLIYIHFNPYILNNLWTNKQVIFLTQTVPQSSTSEQK